MARIFQAGAVIPFQNYILELNMPVRETSHHSMWQQEQLTGSPSCASDWGILCTVNTPGTRLPFFLKQRDTVIYIPSLIPLMSQRVFTEVSQAFEMLAKYSQAFLNSYFCIVMFCSQSPTHLFGLLQSC